MVSFDVESLFTNIPLEECIDVAIEYIRKGNPDLKLSPTERNRGVARIFQRGGGGVTLGQTISSWRFRHGNIVGCLLKKKAYKGGESRASQDPCLKPFSTLVRQKPISYLKAFFTIRFQCYYSYSVMAHWYHPFQIPRVFNLLFIWPLQAISVSFRR